MDGELAAVAGGFSSTGKLGLFEKSLAKTQML